MITGGPRTGKTTLAGPEALHTDDLIGTASWSECSRIVAEDWFRRPGPWVVEGVAAVRALRKFMRLYPGVMPCDRVIWLSEPRVALTPGQERMTKGCVKIWLEIRGSLDVEVVEP